MPRAINNLKICSCCKKEKDINDFYKCKIYKDGKASVCKICNNEKRKAAYLKNYDKEKENFKKYYKENKEICSKRSKEYYYKNKDKISQKNKLYGKEHRSEITAYARNRYHTNVTVKFKSKITKYIKIALRRNTKQSYTVDLLGCTFEQLKCHLQKTAIDNGYINFDINEYSGKDFHIDHIIPIMAFSDLSIMEQQKACFNYSNLQILKSNINISKSDNITTEIPDNIKPFIKPEYLIKVLDIDKK